MSEGTKQLPFPREVGGGLCGRKNHVNLLHMFCRKLFLDVLAVVDHKISAHLMTPLTRLRTRRSAEDTGVCLRFQELRSDGTYSPRSSNDEHPFDPHRQIALLTEDRLPSSKRANWKRGCVNEREVFGNPGKNSVIHCHTISPSTISRHISSAKNSIASFEPANTGPGLDNH